MKGIFSICFLCIAVSVSSAQPKELNLRVGDTVTFHTAVHNEGSLMHAGRSIGTVTNRQMKHLAEQFTGRLQWDSSTGLFSITGLQQRDSGQYVVQNNTNQEKLYNLTVYSGSTQPNVSLIILLITAVAVTVILGFIIYYIREDNKLPLKEVRGHAEDLQM
ncbi:hypothetical protein AGOR_G00194960 [Albula goreensis]|uniref:Uncharacterized protein n=1 Tax=Albula goreensis TaxID=1534307 RepID=A0A8T3CV14_9TELE|nr:hypothetical protein AGOR_G00194960 [Albula goreensis]